MSFQNQEDEQLAIKMAKEGATIGQISDTVSDIEYQTLDETEEIMSLEDNGGMCTIEVVDDDRNTIWHNGKISINESEVKSMAKMMGYELDDSELWEVRSDLYDSARDQDPSGNMVLWLEQAVRDVVNNRKS